MAKRQFVVGETNRAEALREAVSTCGLDSSNKTVKDWVAENWTDFTWGSNPAAELFAARNSLRKAEGVTISKKRGRKKKSKATSVIIASGAAQTKAPKAAVVVGTRSALSLAVELLSATDDAEGVLEKARQIVSAAGSSGKALEIVNLI